MFPPVRHWPLCWQGRHWALLPSSVTGDKAKAKYDSQFLRLTLFTIDQGFGGWTKADKDYFADGGSFDRICTQK